MAGKIIDTLKTAGTPLEFDEICSRLGYAKSGVRSVLYRLQKETGSIQAIVLDDKHTLDLDEILRYQAVKDWSNGLKAGPSREVALYIFYRFWQYVKLHLEFKTPDEMIDNALDSSARGLGKHLKTITGYVNSLEDVSHSTRNKHYVTIRGFYKHHLVSLPESHLQRREAKVPAPPTESSLMGLEDMRKAITSSNCKVLDRAIMMTVLQAGMDDSTLANSFNIFAWPQLVEQFGTEDWNKWDVSKCPIRIDLVRPKEDIVYFTFIDRDAISCIIDWLNVRYNLTGTRIRIIQSSRRQNERPTSDPIFILRNNKPIKANFVSHIFRKTGFASGINVRPDEKLPRYRGALRRYKFHSHEVRDILVSLAEPCNVNPAVVNFFIGHQVDKFHYDKSPWRDAEHYRDKYRILAEHLNILSNDPEKQKIREESKRTIEDLQRKNRRDEELLQSYREELEDSKRSRVAVESFVKKMIASPDQVQRALEVAQQEVLENDRISSLAETQKLQDEQIASELGKPLTAREKAIIERTRPSLHNRDPQI